MKVNLFRIRLTTSQEIYVMANSWEEAISKAEKRIYSDEIITKLEIEEEDEDGIYYPREIVEVTKLWGEFIN